LKVLTNYYSYANFAKAIPLNYSLIKADYMKFKEGAVGSPVVVKDGIYQKILVI
jgi:hypothetical protein